MRKAKYSRLSNDPEVLDSQKYFDVEQIRRSTCDERYYGCSKDAAVTLKQG